MRMVWSVDRRLIGLCWMGVKQQQASEFDILIWWKVNASKYSIFAVIARDVLVIPISTIASEFAFSTGGRVLDSFRSSLSPITVEALIWTQIGSGTTQLTFEIWKIIPYHVES